MLINGKKTQKILGTDRGIRFGDGCFTTAAVLNGKISMFSAHLERLLFTCKRLNITFKHQLQLKKEMYQLASSQKRAVINVIITRGHGGYGYSSKHCTKPTRIVRIAPWPIHYKHWRKHGVTLALSPIRLGRNSYLAGLKHLNRLEQILIRTHLEEIKADEVLVLDSEGLITECCAANIFWRKNNTVYTPKLDHAGVNGIMRQFCLRILASSTFQVIEVYARETELNKSDEIIICNSLMSVVPVRKYREEVFSSRKLFRFLTTRCDKVI